MCNRSSLALKRRSLMKMTLFFLMTMRTKLAVMWKAEYGKEHAYYLIFESHLNHYFLGKRDWVMEIQPSTMTANRHVPRYSTPLEHTLSCLKLYLN